MRGESGLAVTRLLEDLLSTFGIQEPRLNSDCGVVSKETGLKVQD